MPGLEVFLLLALLNAVAMSLHSLTGFGAAAVLAPVLPLCVDHGAAVVAILTLGVVINLLVTMGPPPTEGPVIVRRLLPALIAGAPAGVLLALNLPDRLLQLCVGFVVLVGVAVQLRPIRPIDPRFSPGRGSSPWPPGIASGLFATSVGLGAPPIVLWLDSRREPMGVRRYAVARVFVVPNLLAIGIFLALAPGVTAVGLVLAATLLPTTLIGFMAGRRALSVVGPDGYRIVALAMVIGAALTALATGLWPT